MTSAHRKTGRLAGTDGAPQRCGHASPWALLNDHLDGDHRSGKLFREYAIAFHGRRQLYWSPKLKELFFGIADRSDDDIAAADDARCDEFVCDVLPSQWALVIAHEARFDLLRAAASDGAEGVRALLADLDGRPPPRRSDFFTEGRFQPPPMTTYEAPAGRAVYVER